MVSSARSILLIAGPASTRARAVGVSSASPPSIARGVAFGTAVEILRVGVRGGGSEGWGTGIDTGAG